MTALQNCSIRMRRPSLYKAVLLVAAIVVSAVSLIVGQGGQVNAATGINEQFNYQGRLLTNTGAVVADGTYNMEFTILQDGDGCNPTSGTYPCSGSVEWTETRTGADKVTVRNGYFSVNLGSVTPFSGSVDWNQDTLWLGVNIGGTGSPSWDGVMKPMKRLGASPYALNSKSLGGLLASNFLQLAQGSQTDSSILSSVYINKTGASGNILQLQKNGSDLLVLGNSGGLTLSSGDLMVAAGQGLDTSAAGALGLGNTTATSVSLCNSTACDTVNIGANADADTVSIGDTSALDTINLRGATISINGSAATNAAISIGTTGSVDPGSVAIGRSNTTVTLTGDSASTIVWNGVTLSAAELNILDGGLADFEVPDALTITGGTIDATTTISKSPVITLGSDLSGSVTLTNLASGTLNATVAADSVALGTDTTGNYVSSATASGGLVLTGTEGGSLAIALSSADGTGGTTSGSGLELDTNGVGLLQGCTDGQILKWTDASNIWGCAADSSGGVSDGDKGDITVSGSGATWNIDADSVALGTDTTGNYIAGITAGNGLTGDTASEGGTASLAIGAGNGISVAADSVAVDQTYGFIFTGNTAFTPSSTNDLTLNLDGDSTFAQIFSSGTNASSAATASITNSASSGTVAVNGLTFSLVGTANAGGSNTTSGLTFSNVTAQTNNSYYGLNFGTGLTDILRYNGTQIISGTGVVQSAGLSGSYTGVTGTGALDAGSISSNFGAINVGADNITTTGTVFGNSLDRTSSGVLAIGNTNATSISLCNSATCDTIDIGNLAATDSDTINIGDSLDTIILTGDSSSAIVWNGVTISASELSILDGGLADSEVPDGLTITGGSIDGTTTISKSPVITLGSDLSGTVTLTNLANGTLNATVGADAVALGTDTTGNYVASATASGGLVLTGTEAGSLGIALSTADGSGLTTSGSGLELDASGLGLLQGCTDGQILKWTDASNIWGCAADASGGGGVSDGDKGDITVSASGATYTLDTDITKTLTGALTFAPSGTDKITFIGDLDSNVVFDSTNDLGADITTALNQNLAIAAAGSGNIYFGVDTDTNVNIYNASVAQQDLFVINDASSGTVSNGKNAIKIIFVQGDDADATDTNSGLSISLTSSSGDADTLYGININDLTGGAAAETALRIGSGWDTGLSIATDSITTGRGLSITSTSTGLSSTGALAEFTLSGSDAANLGSIVKISNTGVSSGSVGLYIDHRATGTGNLALRVDDFSGDTSPFIVDGDGRVGIGTSSITGTTERLLQVGSPTDRGNAAIYGELVSKGMRDLTALTNIKDMFIYDTTRDSDGGRWIDWATTDKLSWHDEQLDDSPSDPCDIVNDDRCYSQTFPRKALLVVTTDALYIFDAQSNTMWMKFSQNSAGWALGADTNNDPSSVSALNGVIYVGTNGSSAGGLYAFDFTGDRMWNYDGTDRSGADVGIGGRNGTVAYASDNNTALDIATTGTVADWGRINDVSATMLTNSLTPIAATTGPNNGTVVIGLATDSGLTVINPTTQKVFQYSDATDNDYNSVTVTRTGRLYGLNEALGQLERWNNIDNENLATRVNGTPNRVWDETTTPALSKSAPTVIAGAPDAIEIVERGSSADGGVLSTAAAAGSSDLIYAGTNQGLTEIHDHATAASAWSKFYTTTRQTALMPATIRRMHMMDDASGDVTNQSNKTSVMVPKGTPTYGVDGVRGKAMSFNGTSQYLCSGSGGVCATDATDNMSTGSWTISTWFKHSPTIAGTDVLFARCHNTTPAPVAGCVAASMTSTGTMAVNVDFDATFTIGATGTTVFHNSVQTFNDNQWHYLSVTRAATTGNINTMIDGKPIGQTAGVNTTLDASQILSIGADCSVGAACATGANFWDGSIDDFQYSTNGSTGTDNNLTTTAMHRLYNDARPTLSKKVYNGASNTVSYTSTTLTDSSTPNWVPNEFAGLHLQITSGTGANQTRRIIGNTANTITVSPAFTTTPASNDDYKIDPEALIGSSNSVTAIGTTAESPIGEARMLCAGTNDGSDGGAVTCLNHQAGPNIVAETYHNDAAQSDDGGAAWSGANYDDIRSIDFSGNSLAIGTEAHTWYESQDVKLGQGLDYLSSQLFNIRGMLMNLGLNTLAGSTALDIGFTGGADLAERFTSTDPLNKGNIVVLDDAKAGAVKMSTQPYQKEQVGIVATEPGAVLGPDEENSYPIALVGRVPVTVTTENGVIKAGDRVTASSTPGFGMKAVQSGRVVGTALDDFLPLENTPCPEGLAEGVTCGTVTVFVNLTDYNGEDIEVVAQEAYDGGLYWGDEYAGSNDVALTNLDGLEAYVNEEVASARRSQLEKTDRILRYLAGRRDAAENTSGILTDKVSAGTVNGATVNAQEIFAGTIQVNKLKANQIEGLEILTDRIASRAAQTAVAGATTENGPAIDMSNFAVQRATVAVELSVNGALLANNGLTVGGDAVFNGNTMFNRLVVFMERTVFKNDIAFEGRATFNNDTAGFAIIKAGQKEIPVKFKKPFDKPPVVTVTIKNGLFDRYAYKDLNEEGFVIVLENPASQDVEFAWTAWSAQDARTIQYDQNNEVQQQLP